MAGTTQFDMPLMEAAAAQKSVDYNEALPVIDALLSRAVENSTLTAPPGSPGDGLIWAVPAAATDDWVGQDGNLAIFIGGGWVFKSPVNGVVFLDKANAVNVASSGSNWSQVLTGGGAASVVENVYRVAKSGTAYSTIQLAVDAIIADGGASLNNRAVISVSPGYYEMTAPITLPSFVEIRGVSKGAVQFYNETTNMFICSGNNWFENFLIEASPNPAIFGFDGNDSTAIHIRNVDMLNNGGIARQKFLTQSGASWIVLFIEDCIIDYYNDSGYAVELANTGPAARFVDAIINNVFFDAYQLTAFGGSFSVTGCQDVRVKRSTIRGSNVFNTGIRNNAWGGTGTPEIKIFQCDMEGGVPIYNAAGTHIITGSTLAPGSIFDGTQTTRPLI